MQAIAVDATGGSFTVTFGASTTGDISATASPGTVQAAINGLTSVIFANGSVTVGGSPGSYAVAFGGGSFAGKAESLSAASSGGDPLTGGSASVNVTATHTPGNLYYLSESSGLYGFDSSSGTPLAGLNPKGGFGDPCGSGVDTAGNIWVGDYGTQSVEEFDSAGAALGSVDTSAQGHPCHVAFDSNGDMFAAMFEGEVWKYAAPAYTTATLIDPARTKAIAVDTTARTLYVAHSDKVSAYNATTGAFLYEFADGIADERLTGVAVDQGADTAYVFDGGSSGKVYSFSAAQAYGNAGATLNTPDTSTGTSAGLSATLTDNNVLPTSWRLEFSKDGGTNWSTVSSGQTSGSQSNVTVSGTVTGLIPGSPSNTYSFRLVTNKGHGAADVVAGPLDFGTAAVAPATSEVGAVEVSDTSARLVGTVNPNNSATGYVFQYGTTPALGSSTTPVDIGAGTDPLVVSQVISGLAKDTSYYFRLVATNLAGTTNSAGATVHTRATPLPLPDDRAYEQVSPVDKNGGEAFSPPTRGGGFSSFSYAALNGNAFAYSAPASFGDPASDISLQQVPYVSKRTASGWQNRAARPVSCLQDPKNSVPANQSTAIFVNANIESAVFYHPEGLQNPPCQLAPLSPNAPTPGANLYRVPDLGADPPAYDLLTPQPAVAAQSTSYVPAGGYGGSSDDQSTIVFQSTAKQTADALPGVNGHYQLYDWQQLGTSGCTNASPSYNPGLGDCLNLVSKDPAGNPLGESSFLPGPEDSIVTSTYGRGNTDAFNPVSANGQRIFFQYLGVGSTFGGATGCGKEDCKLYMRENNTATIDVSASECTANCGATPRAKTFMMADPSGDKALFISAEKLTDSDNSSNLNPGSDQCVQGRAFVFFDNCDLFRWSRDADGSGQHLVDLSVDNESADGTEAGVQGFVGASDDLNTVFFVAGGQLAAGHPTAAGPKLYRWHWDGSNASIQYLATLDPADTENWGRNERRVTPSGDTLMIESKARIDPAADHDSDIDVYRWAQGDGFSCVSCQFPGTASNGDSTTSLTGKPNTGFSVSDELSSAISDDGERLFFLTPDALVPQDTNGPCSFDNVFKYFPCADVYEWHDGRVSLITPGDSSSATETELLGASASGNDVFFKTRQPLVGWDLDKNTDIYDARVGGGFPEPPAEGAPCEGEGCRSAASSSSGGSGAGTASFQGPGDPPAAHGCPKGKVRRNSRCIARHIHKHHRKRNAKHNRRASR